MISSAGEALPWPYHHLPAAPSSGPRGPLWAKPCSGGSPRPDARSARRLYAWRWYLAPMWQEEMGAALWRPTRQGWVEIWGDPPACWYVRPFRRLTLLEGQTATGRPHTVGVDWWYRVWDNDPARPPPPPPTTGLRRRSWTWPTRCVPSSPWSPTCGGPPCRSRGRSMPRPSGLTSCAVPTRGLSRCSCTRSSRKLAASPGHRSKAAPCAREPPPCRSPQAGRHLSLRCPLNHLARPP